ncbi:MAG: hypothetical protein WC824_10805 [Bacteroidota bacterium]|jgi:hypothetical protein
MSRKIKVTMTEEQAKLLSQAAELYARLMTGQLEVLAECLPGTSPLAHFINTGKINAMDEAVKDLKHVVTGFSMYHSYGIHNPVVPEKARVLYDLHQVLRHQVQKNKPSPWKGMQVWDDPPMQVSEKTPLATIEEIPDPD